jgi:ribosomal protein S2
MRVYNNSHRIGNVLCSLGAHIGHLKVEAYQSMSHYVLGGRGLFVVIDLDKTVPMLKSAIVFFEQMILHYGHAVFCHSGIARLSTMLLDYVSRIVTHNNQSFSYWRWVPGCITNYRYVFLRLVELLFREVRSSTTRSKTILVKSYNRSFYSYYNKLWLWFVNESNITISYSNLKNIRRKFNSFFSRNKHVLLNKYLSDSFKRNIVAYEFVKHASGTELSDSIFSIQHNLRNRNVVSRYRNRRRNISKRISSLRTLPSFVSLLFRICYVMKHKAKEIKSDYSEKQVNEEALFSFLFNRLHVFWRATIFFKCFKKTSHLPDCLVMLNPDNSSSEFNDFIGVKLPIIGITDTITDFASITYPIPSNDDSLVLFIFYMHVFLESVNVAKKMRFF